MSEVATIDLVNGPLQINRDATKRRVVIGVNVRDADIQQVVAAIRRTLEENVQLNAGLLLLSTAVSSRTSRTPSARCSSSFPSR